MKEYLVPIGITLRVFERELKMEKKADLNQLEEAIQGIVKETGQRRIKLGIISNR